MKWHQNKFIAVKRCGRKLLSIITKKEQSTNLKKTFRQGRRRDTNLLDVPGATYFADKRAMCTMNLKSGNFREF